MTQRIPVAEAQFGANPGANPGATSDIAVAVQAGAVWFVTTTDQLVRVDAGTNKVVRRIHLGEAARALAIGPDGNVWVVAQAA